MNRSATNVSDGAKISSAKLLGSDEAAELRQLFDALPIAIKHARNLFHNASTESLTYIEADNEIARIIARINALLNG